MAWGRRFCQRRAFGCRTNLVDIMMDACIYPSVIFSTIISIISMLKAILSSVNFWNLWYDNPFALLLDLNQLVSCITVLDVDRLLKPRLFSCKKMPMFFVLSEQWRIDTSCVLCLCWYESRKSLRSFDSSIDYNQ